MKFILLIGLMVSNIALAKDVDGKITYKLPSGDLVDRDVVLNVPARGQGAVVLSGKNFEWRSKNFKTVKFAGKTTFVVVFDSELRGEKFKTMLKGTYLKGNNKLIYTGDVFKGKKKNFDHSGVFNFSYDR